MSQLSTEPSDQSIIKERNRATWLRLTRNYPIENFLVVWLDASNNELKESMTTSVNKLEHIVNTVKIFNESNACIDFITDAQDETVFLIISNELSECLIPLVEQLAAIHSIYIFSEQEVHSQSWTSNHKKVKGVYAEIDTLCTTLKHNTYQSFNDYTSFSIQPTVNSSIVKFDELDSSFMYSQLLKEIIVDIEFSENARTEFVDFCRGQYVNNNVRLNIINQFESNYESHSPIWWYTKEPFVYSVLNQALRKQDIEMIIMMGFFIQDLHRQMERVYAQKPPTSRSILYRGQGMSTNEFEKLRQNEGGLLSFNSFLSTSLDRDVAFAFASSAKDDPDLVGILFCMDIDPSISTVPFVPLDEMSFYSNIEQEILFSMHTVFRIDTVTKIEDRLWQIRLKLTSNTDQQLKLVTECIRNEIGDNTGWARMAGLMLKMGKFDRALETYVTLLRAFLNNTSKESKTGLPVILSNTAVAHASLGAYETAHVYYERIIKMLEKLLPSNNFLLVVAYTNIGALQVLFNNFTVALSYFQKAYEIINNYFPTNQIELANIYGHIGKVNTLLGDYSTALLNYEKALGIQQKFLPSFHPDLAITYMNMGELHESMANYIIALKFFEKTLEIEQRTLPPLHPDLAIIYSFIGGIYESLGKYSDALSYYERELDIQEKSLPSNHPDRALALNSVGVVHQSLGDNTKALSYYKKSLEIANNALPPDDLSLAPIYNNIATVYESMTDYQTAISFFEKALNIEQKSLPPIHLGLANTYAKMGGLYQSMENNPNAIFYYNKAIEIQEKLLEPDHSNLAITYNDIGLVYQSMKDYSLAFSYYDKALKIQQKRLLLDHPHIAVTYHNLGDLCVSMEDYTTALSYYEKSLEIKHHSLPQNHPSFPIIYNNVGQIYKAMENYPIALSYYEKQLKIQLESTEPDELDIGFTYKTIAEIHVFMDNYSQALSFYKKAFEIHEKHLSPDDADLLELKQTIIALEALKED